MCATCRGETADCPSCRLAAKIDAASGAQRTLGGRGGPSSGAASDATSDHDWRFRQAPPQRRPPRYNAVANLRPESRALVALGYPFWPLALIALFDRSNSDFMRKNAWQALGFNAGMYGLGWLFTAIASIPIIGIPAWPLIPFIIPVTIVASVVYAIKAWHGEDVHVPFVSDLVDEKMHPSH